MSRPRTSTQLLEAAGSFVHDPQRREARANEPVPPCDVGQPHRSLTRLEKAAWRELVANAPPGVLKNSDRALLEIASRLTVRARSGDARIGEIALLCKCLGSMGMSPADRSRVQVVTRQKSLKELLSEMPRQTEVN